MQTKKVETKFTKPTYVVIFRTLKTEKIWDGFLLMKMLLNTQKTMVIQKQTVATIVARKYIVVKEECI